MFASVASHVAYVVPSSGSVILASVLARNSVAEAIQQLPALLPNATGLNPLELLRWPGVIETKAIDPDSANAAVLASLDSALQELVTTREREGDVFRDDDSTTTARETTRRRDGRRAELQASVRYGLALARGATYCVDC